MVLAEGIGGGGSRSHRLGQLLGFGGFGGQLIGRKPLHRPDAGRQFPLLHLLNPKPLVRLPRQRGINLNARDAFQQLFPLVVLGFQKFIEATLRQQHRAGELRVFHARQGFVLGNAFFRFLGQELAIGPGAHFHVSVLQGPAHLFAGPLNAPFGQKAPGSHLVHYFGPTLGGAVADERASVALARRAAVESQRNSIEQGGFTRARGTRDGKQTAVFQRRGFKIEPMHLLAPQGVEILASNGNNFHNSVERQTNRAAAD